MQRKSRRLWRRYWRFLRDVGVETWRDDLPLLAAALAHFALLSFIPLLLLVLSVLGAVLQREAALQQAQLWADTVIRSYFPPVAPEAIEQIFLRLAAERGPIGGFGLIALLWISMRIFVTLQLALDRIWNIQHEERRHPLLQWLLAVPTVLALGLVALLSSAVTVFVGSLPLFWPSWVPDLNLPSPVKIASDSISLVLSITLMFLIYRLLPTQRPRARSAWPGAIVAGLGWEVSKRLFTWFVTHFSQTDQFYGTMGGIVLFSFWTYLSALILLFGAEVVSCHARRIAQRPVLEREDSATPPGPLEPDDNGEPAATRATAAESQPPEPAAPEPAAEPERLAL